MKLDRGILTLVLICAVLILFSLLGLVFDFTTLMEFHPTLDGILLLFVCLMMAGLFSLMLFQLAKAEGWLDHLPFVGKKGASSAGPAEAEKDK